MTVESFLTGKLRRFTLVDIALVKAVYFLFGLLVLSQYPPLTGLAWWSYAVVVIVCAFPLIIRLFSFEGGLSDKGRAYLQNNTPAFQVLLFLSQFFFALMLGLLFPVLATGVWWLYVGLIVLLAIKPMTHNVFW